MKTRDGIKKKADGNRRQSTFLLLWILLATVFSPILILAEWPDALTIPAWPDLISSFVPAVLTGSAAVASGWTQLKKPQERWILYRTAQRRIEYELDQYQFRNGDYATGNPAALLTDRVSKQALALHFDWVPLVPRANEVADVTPQRKS